MAILFALLASTSWGTVDFLGGLASRRAHPVAVTFTSEGIAFLLLVPVTLVVKGAPSATDIGLGLVAGIGGALALTLFYRALAVGRMSVVAPITGATTATVPVIAGVILGERPGPGALAGILGALVAIALVSAGTGPSLVEAGPPDPEIAEPPAPSAPAAPAAGPRPPRLGEVPLSILCGALFGSFLVLIHQTGDDSGLWPLTASFAGGVAAVAVLARFLSSPLLAPRVVAPMMVTAGILGAGGGVLYVAATHSGLLSVVAVLSSLYPAVTVGLARVVLHERFGRVQALGLALAAISIVLLGSG
ncbi:MAG: protein of unknown function transrane [Actinomycetia bacterium]|nr:protein of unknown function transrane [Actinomycetes bacterium]